MRKIVTEDVSGDTNLAGLANGSNAPSSNNIGSLVNLSGHQLSQSVTSTIPMAGNTSLIGNILINDLSYSSSAIFFINIAGHRHSI
jgi:hypothetical protein